MNAGQKEEAASHSVSHRVSSIRDTNELLGLFFKTSRDAIVITNEERRFLEVNAAACALFDYTPEEMTAQRIDDVVALRSPGVAASDQDIFRTGSETGTFTFVRPDSGVRTVSYSTCCVMPDRYVTLFSDITEQQRVVQALRETETRVNSILEGMTDAFLVLDQHWRIRFINREAARLNGKPAAEFLGKTHWEEWPASVGSPVEAAYRRSMEQQVTVHFEHHYQDTDHDVWLEITAYPTSESLGIFYRDVGERKRAEQALRESEERFHAAVLAVGDIVWTNSSTGRMTGEQAGWGAFTGQSYAEYQGHGWADAVHPEDAKPTIDAWNQAVAARALFAFEHRLQRHDGVWKLFSIRAVPVLNADGTIREWVGVHSDITERRKSEQEIEALNARLRRAMTETHHRIKNNLQLMAALIELRRLKCTDCVPIADVLHLEQNIQALGVIHDILTTEAAQDGDAASLSVKSVLERLLPILKATLGGRSLEADLQEIVLPGKQATMLAVIANELISNAVKHGEGEIRLMLTIDQGHVSLEVSDYGPGFNAGFKPNTGLELIDSITRFDLQGEISYENRPEGGARIVVVFPVEHP